jgi:hypothetical protein
MIGRVGDDIFGQDMRANLAAEGIDTRFIGVTPATASGVAVITVDEQGQNTIVVIPGANHAVTPDDIAAARVAIDEAAVLVMQMELPLEANLAALRLAQGGALTLFNSAPVSSALPDALYPLCDIFCPNETEIELLTGIAVQSRADAEAACRALLARGARNILLTMGERGSRRWRRLCRQLGPLPRCRRGVERCHGPGQPDRRRQRATCRRAKQLSTSGRIAGGLVLAPIFLRVLCGSACPFRSIGHAEPQRRELSFGAFLIHRANRRRNPRFPSGNT